MEEQQKITYEKMYNDACLGIDFKNLITVEATIPEELKQFLFDSYTKATESNGFKFTFNEYIGIMIVAGLVLRRHVEDMV